MHVGVIPKSGNLETSENEVSDILSQRKLNMAIKPVVDEGETVEESIERVV